MLRRLATGITSLFLGIIVCRAEAVDLHMLDFCTFALEGGASLSADGRELYFHATWTGGVGLDDLWVARRDSPNGPWTRIENAGTAANSNYNDWAPCISADGLTLYFASDRPNENGGYDIWFCTRASAAEPWQKARNAGPGVNSSSNESYPFLSSDGLSLYFSEYYYASKSGFAPYDPREYRAGGFGRTDLWVSTRSGTDKPWGAARNLGPQVNSDYVETCPTLSGDGLTLFFSSIRPEGLGQRDIWCSRRTNSDAPWGRAEALGPDINGSWDEKSFVMARDDSSAFLCANRPGGAGSEDIYLVTSRGSAVPLIVQLVGHNTK